MKMRTLIMCLLLMMQQAFSYAQCGGYDCSNATLQSLTSVNALGGSGDGNDSWGWTDPTNDKEYAIMGVSNGTSFVDITNPSSPIVLGFLPTQTNSSSWRDIKVVNDHAYIVSEAGSHGIQVFDLTRLRSVASPPVTFNTDGFTNAIGSAHNIVGLEETGYVIAVGAGSASGGLVFFDVNNDPSDGVNGTPTSPVQAGTFSADGYTHDAVCFVYRGPDKQYIGKEICIAFNEDTNTIVDATDKSNIVQLSRTPYAGSRYTHQGWITDDHRYMLVNDELDEQNGLANTRTYIFDISDLDAPSIIGFHDHPFAAIDHNLYIKGRYAYLANYRSGLRVMDISDIANGNLTEVAGFDTYQGSNSGQFNGAWNNYPYFKSGNVIISDIEEGLFVVQPQFSHYSFSFNNAADGVVRMCPDATATFTLNIDGYAGFSSNVNLSLSGLDPGLTATLSSTSVAPGSDVTITITSANGGIPSCVGNFCVLLTGNQGDAATEQSIALGIVVDDTLPGCVAGSVCPSCFDGILNGNETGIDCGGPDCDACPTCSDGIQNGNETGIDCGGPDCTECLGPCGNTPYLNCNSTISDNNGNGTDEINAYPNAFGGNDFTGPEMIYTFTVATAGTVNIFLTGANGDLDLFLFNACDPNGNPLGTGLSGSNTTESITNVTLAPGTYFLFVDGYAGATSDYDLELTCPQGDCTDGVQNESETGVDCGGPDCPECVTDVFISPKVFLQGPFNTADMTLGLGTNIPTAEPYTALGYMHVGGGGGESSLLGIINANDIIDWVVVELRDKTNSATILATRSALLRKDGSVVSHLDGSSPVQFSIAPDDYYVSIRHRNHLGVMTNAPVTVD